MGFFPEWFGASPISLLDLAAEHGAYIRCFGIVARGPFSLRALMGSRFQWYWHRLRAMSPGEMLTRAKRKVLEWEDRRSPPIWPETFGNETKDFPKLPDPSMAPPSLRAALLPEDILAGRWRAFGNLPLQVDDPPNWHKDYLAAIESQIDKPGFEINHRSLGGADSKLIWELSRWSQLVRLAQASYILRDKNATNACIRWLQDWVKSNPPFRGINWTSPLEAGLRLVQYAWIDALLSANGHSADLLRLRANILPAHAWFVWRHHSIGSSANNHLLGELSGLLVALARWPELERWSASVDKIAQLWQVEVFSQFADDGGNKEQALNYQLFSLELCLQASWALRALGVLAPGLLSKVDARLIRAAQFYIDVQEPRDPWDYGDSDNAFVTPFFESEKSAVREWHAWLMDSKSSPALQYWLASSSGGSPSHSQWKYFEESGIAVSRANGWMLRFDVSPLGYLAPASHGHLDALHLSLWFEGVALVIDPGTGAYYADSELRAWLASWQAHNAPVPEGLNFPKRLGPFLWSDHHQKPRFKLENASTVRGELDLPSGRMTRRIVALEEGRGYRVEDGVSGADRFTVFWQFSPRTEVESLPNGNFIIRRNGKSFKIEVFSECHFEIGQESGEVAKLQGVCSPSFRQIVRAPFLRVSVSGQKPCLLRTTFLACPPA